MIMNFYDKLDLNYLIRYLLFLKLFKFLHPCTLYTHIYKWRERDYFSEE
jgi:hypothetical protein